MSNTYTDRNKTLASMGFTSYAEYLQSDTWSAIRVRAFQTHGALCRLCGKQAYVIHHVSYGRATLTGEDLSNLSPLCHGCHVKVEFDVKDKKLTLAQSQTKYRRLYGTRVRALSAQVVPAMGGRKNPDNWLSLEWRLLTSRCLGCGCKKSRKRPDCTTCAVAGRRQVTPDDVTSGRAELKVPSFVTILPPTDGTPETRYIPKGWKYTCKSCGCKFKKGNRKQSVCYGCCKTYWRKGKNHKKAK